MGDMAEPARRFIHVFEGEAEGAVVHWDEPPRAQIFEDFHGLVRAHVHVAEGFGVVSADGEQRDFRRAAPADFFEAIEIGAVAGVIDAATLMFEDKTAVAAMMIAQNTSAPMFARGQSNFPVAVREGFPPFKFDDAAKAEVVGEVTDAPGHDADFWMGQPAKARLMEMIEMSVGQEDEIDGGQMLDAKARAFDAFEKEQPVGEVRIDQDVEIGELDEKGGVANPGDCYLTFAQFGKGRLAMLPGAPGEQGFPNHFPKKGAWIEMFGGG